ncbi:MAG: glycosyltransferase family 2 protein [Thermoanaerobaculum sp.]|nr:glycosyltransferase family 2 protein [Thermoanaerobaculum sp.]MDW7966661.1 glycosyltransferase family 2 protein [Thermoanaerobaculum sp.]
MPQSDRPALSVLITAKNEEEMLPGALASVAEVAGEVVVVVDAASTDATEDLARQAGARVFRHPFVSSAQQINWGLELCTCPWVLVLDADERVSPPLAAALTNALKNPQGDAYAVRRLNWALGRRVRFGDWGWDWVVRVVRRQRVRFADRWVHGVAEVKGAARLPGPLHHLTFRSFSQYLPKVVAYALRGAQQARREGKRCSLGMAVARAEWRFVRSYLLRLGFLDGRVGLILAVLAAYGTFLKWASVAAGADEAALGSVE